METESQFKPQVATGGTAPYTLSNNPYPLVPTWLSSTQFLNENVTSADCMTPVGQSVVRLLHTNQNRRFRDPRMREITS